MPGLGFGAWICQAKSVSDKMVTASALALADFVTEEELSDGNLYPALIKIREISAIIAAQVIEQAFQEVCAYFCGQLLTRLRVSH